MERVFFTSGGSEAVESALKLCRNWHRLNGDGQRIKVIAREIAYHGTTLGALSATGIPGLRAQFEPLTPGGCHVPNTNSYRWPEDRDPLWAADQIEHRILFEGPETVSAVILEPVQNAGGCFAPPEGYWQRVREICDRYGVLLISDEVICSWGRLGHYFGAQRYDYSPDLITTAKGTHLGVRPDGCADRVGQGRRPVHGGHGDVRPRPHVRRPSDRGGDRAREPRHLRARDLCGHVLEKEPEFRGMLDALKRDLAIVGDVRGAGYFQALELVKDKDTKETFSHEEAETLLRGYVSPALYDEG